MIGRKITSQASIHGEAEYLPGTVQLAGQSFTYYVYLYNGLFNFFYYRKAGERDMIIFPICPCLRNQSSGKPRTFLRTLILRYFLQTARFGYCRT
ncbi:hypothetical protein [Alteribacillus sp. HJP-4]|uniref:hypothetical protein n=1 Tax=Alteribacillus sp. HJP-4 TaxID=2775394 RepID=UPI0035CCC9DD